MLTHLDRHADSELRGSARRLNSRILIVRHGAGRGPAIRLRQLRPARCQPMFDDIVRRWPDVGRKLDYWETGQPLPDVSDVAVVLFLLQDPLRETSPECYQDAVRLADHAREAGARIINAPECLSNTIKTTQSRLWHDAGLNTPPCIPFSSPEELYAAADEIQGAMIIKSDTEHAQKNAHVIKDVEALRSLPIDEIAFPGALSPLVDTRAGYQAIDPQSPYATHFHKKRAMVFGKHVSNNHVFFADQPIVGCISSTFGHFRSLNPIRRAIGNTRCRSHIQSDLDYHNSEPEQAETMVKAAKVLGTEFCAIDYSTHADGSVVLWEANPFFSLHRWPIAVLAHKRKLAVRIPNLHETAAHFFRDLLSDAS